MKRIGKYIIRGLLGRGGMSRVFKVEIPEIDKIVALKLLDPHPVLVDVLGNRRLRRLFRAEARLLASLNHPNIAAIRDYDEDGGRPFYVMDYFSGSLGALIGEPARAEEPSRPVRPDRALDFTRQTLEGLACLHYHGIVHRDIKPFNLLLDGQGVVKICDFGLSRLRGEPAPASTKHLKIGSPWYAPPEQERDPDAVDARADLYSAGVTFYRLLTGTLPAAPPLPTSAFNPDLNAQWDALVERATAARPADRFADAGQMLSALADLEHAWLHRQEQVCRLSPPQPAPIAPLGEAPLRLRREPVRIAPRQARREFGVDPLWRPADFAAKRLRRSGFGTVHDAATGLTWQQSGSPYAVDWNAARRYVAELNRRRFGGGAWRLPTAPELMSLLAPTPRGADFCIEPVFDRTQRSLWSADRRSFTAAWFVDVEFGFVAWQDFSARCHVRAVCTASG